MTTSIEDDITKIESDDFKEFHEVKIPVHWGYISGLWYGPLEAVPIIAMHGWQENAGTLVNLVKLISKDVSVLIIDLPGHGQSSHYPPERFYYLFWDGVLILRKIVTHYRWDKIKLLGHSLGGAISFLYAASFPDEVEFIICLDSVSPSIHNIESTVDVTGDHIDKFLKIDDLNTEETPCYDYKLMIDIVENAYNGSITRESAEILMKRGMKPALIPGKYYFSRDSRLKISSLGIFSLDVSLAYAARIKCAYLNIRAKSGMKFNEPDNYQTILDVIKQNSKRYEYYEVEGTHHVHLNNPERVAPIINKFISL